MMAGAAVLIVAVISEGTGRRYLRTPDTPLCIIKLLLLMERCLKSPDVIMSWLARLMEWFCRFWGCESAKLCGYMYVCIVHT